jgi:DNA-binding CsgD family transcriptional regulator
MPLLFSVTVRGCHYPESQALIDALLLYLRQVWDVEDVLSLNHTPLPSVASADSEMPITSSSDNHSLAGARTEVLVDAAAPEQNTGTSGIEVDTRLLNATERVIVEMFNDGFTTGPIAAKTGITFHSVENYKTSIRKKYPGLLLTDKERRKRGIKRRKDWLD